MSDRTPNGAAAGEPVSYEMGYLSDDARRTLEERLVADRIDHQWTGTTLQVPPEHDDAAFAVIAELETDASARGPAGADALDGVLSPLAGWSARFRGLLVDLVITTVVSIAIGSQTGGASTVNGQPLPHPLERTLLTMAFQFVYIVGTMATSGRTLGMRVVKTRLVDVRDGRRPPFAAVALRWAPLPAAALVGRLVAGAGQISPLFELLPAVLVYGAMFVRRDRRGLHDVLSRTVVVEDWFDGDDPLHS